MPPPGPDEASGPGGRPPREPGGPLVSGVGVRVKETDGHPLETLPTKRLHDRGDLVERERRQNRAVWSDALRDLEPQPPGDERLGLRRQVEMVEMRPVLPRDLEHVPEPAGREKADGRGPALDDGVGHDRGAVSEGGWGPARPRPALEG